MKTGGRSPDAVEFLSEVCFDDLSHLPYVSLVRVVNKNILKTLYVDLNQGICEFYSQNLQKQTPKIFKTGGRTPGAPVLDPPLISKGR